MRWRRAIGWAAAVMVAVPLAAAIGGYLYLNSTGFQQYALHKIETEAGAATGGRMKIGSLDFSLSTLTAHLNNITLRGTESPDSAPLLHADKITVRITIVSALRREVSLSELLIEHPAIHLQVAQNGKNNVPSSPPSDNTAKTNVFDLAIGHAQVSNGEISYNDRQVPIEADLHNLSVNIRFVPLLKHYDGELSYTDGRLRYAECAPLPHGLNIQFDASPERFHVPAAVLNVGSSVLTLRADLTNYSSPIADGDYQLRIHAQDFSTMAQTAAPAGDVTLAGKLHFHAEPNQPVLRSISIDGRLVSEALAATAAGKRVEVRKVEGVYQLSGGNLTVSNVSAESMGGRVTGDLQMADLDTTPKSRARMQLHDISLHSIQQLMGKDGQSKRVAVSGIMNGTAEADWVGSSSHATAKTDLTIRAAASHASAHEVPVDGAIHAAYDGAKQTIVLRQTSFRTATNKLTADGEIGDHSNLRLELAANDLGQLTSLASSFMSSETTLPAISGSATLVANVQGTMKRPVIAGEISAQNLKVEGSDWSSAKLQLRASPSEFAIQNATFVNSHQGQATFSGRVALNDWSYQPSQPLKANVDIQRLAVTDLLRLAKQQYPVSGDLSAKISLEGSQLDPSGSGTAQISNARAGDEPIQNLSLRFHASSGMIGATLNVSAPAGSVDANLDYTPRTKAYKLSLNAPSVVLQKLKTVQEKNLGLSGEISASATGEGTLDNPQLSASVRIPQLQFRDNSVSGINAELHVAQNVANLELNTEVSKTSIHARGRVDLSGDYYTEASIDTGIVPLDALLATYAKGSPQGIAGQTEFHATLKGPLKDKSQLKAELNIPVLKASYQSLELGITKPIRAEYADSVITLQPAEIQGTGTSLRLQGQIPIGRTATPTLSAQGSLDVRVLRILNPDLQSSGVVALDLRSSGSASNPDVQGQLQLKDIALATSDAPVGIEKLNGAIDITRDHLQISSMTGQVGGGTISVGGAIAYKPNVQFNLALQGKGIRLRYPDGLRSVLDANLAYSGTTQDSNLTGRVMIDNLSFTSDFDLAKFSDQFSTGTATPVQPGFADTVALSIGVQSQESLNATSSQVSIAGRVALQVGGTAANPVITGRTSFNSGEMFYRNVRYQLQKGVITFDDPNETHPVMNVSVTTMVEQYNLTLNLRGPLDKLTTSYVSDPPLAEADIINLVARGKTTQESAASSQSTDSMIASQAASQVSSGVQKLVGLSSLQIDPLIGNSQNPSAVVAIQQRVTKNLLFTFSTDVSQPGSEMVQGEYQINKRWSVNVARDQLGGFSVDGKFHTRF